MKGEKCQVGLFLAVTVDFMEKEQSLYLTDETLASIFKHDVSKWKKAPLRRTFGC